MIVDTLLASRVRFRISSRTFGVLLSVGVLWPGASLAGQELRINEVMAANAETIADEDGDFEDWVELHNPGTEPVNLEGWGLSDDYDSPFLWTFPDIALGPDEYLLVWASGKDRSDPNGSLHTNYSISSAGEEVLLTRPDGTRVDELPPTPIPGDISIGRLSGEGDAWFFFDEPTPGAANTTPGYDEILEPPEFSHAGGFYGDPVSLALSAAEGVTILYTLDGSEPDPDGIGGTTYLYKNAYPNGGLLERTVETFEYQDPILIEDRSGHADPISGINTQFESGPHSPPGDVFSGTPVRARAFREGAMPSASETHTFFVHPEADSRYDDILVLSIVTDERNLFDYESGIYVPGVYADEWWADNAPTFDGWSPANYQGRGMEWERPAHLEVFEPDGDRALAQGIGLRSHGGWSRYFAWKKSVRIYARGAYDDASTFEYAFLPGLERRGDAGGALESFRRVILRTSGNDWNQTMFRDAVQQHLVRDLPVDSMAHSRPIVHFINGKYWGILNIRERMDQHYLASHYGIDPDDAVILDVLPVVDPDYVTMTDGPYYSGLPKPHLMVKRGTLEDRDEYLAMVAFAVENDLSEPDNYEYLATRMDMENFAAYLAVHVYTGNQDWPQNNRDFWRKRTEEYDPDAPHGHDGRWRWMLYDLDFGFDTGRISANSLARIVEGRDIGGHYGSPPDWSIDLIRNVMENPGFREMFINRVAEMSTYFHPDRVNEAVDTFNARIASHRTENSDRWGSSTNEAGFMRSFGEQRAAQVRSHVMEVFDLPGTADVTVVEPFQEGGRVKVNDLTIDETIAGSHSLPGTDVNLIDFGAGWRYLDDGSDQGDVWRYPEFDDTAWSEGPGSFGFGEPEDYATEIDYGADSENKPITTYFRKEFDWHTSEQPETLTLGFETDAGAVFYLNGEEVLRHRMPEGPIDYTTPASGEIDFSDWGDPDVWFSADGDMQTRTDFFGATRVTEWNDRSENGRDAVQGSNQAQPTFLENEINGLPVVRFSGGNQYLEAPIDDWRDGMTLYLVARVYEDGGSYDSYLGTNGAGSGNVLYHVGSGGGRGLGITQPSENLGNNTTFSDAFELIRIRADDEYHHTMTRVLSGESVEAQLLNTGGTVNNLTLGASKHGGDGITDHLPVDIAEVIVFGRQLDFSESRAVEMYLADRYGFELPEAGTPSFSYEIDAGALTGGDNVLAAEIHLASSSEPRMIFDARLSGRTGGGQDGWLGTYFQGVPVRVEAVPQAGYRFAGWTGRDETDPVLNLDMADSVTLAAEFELDEDGLDDLVPQPHDLSAGPYHFSEWHPEQPEGTYPANMVFEQTSFADPDVTTGMDGIWTLPYDLDSRSRINGLGEDGFAFINTANAQDHPDSGYLGTALLALDTRGQDDLRVTWRAGTVLPNSRVYNLRLQYRVGDDGQFLDVLDENGVPVEYQRHAEEGHTEVIGPVALPEELEDEPVVQLRWKYYYTGVRLDPESGQRSKLRIDEILVTGGEHESGGHELAFEDFHPAGQTDKPLIPFSVAALGADGTADLAFGGSITVSLDEGPGDLEGTLTRSASGGRAEFDDLTVDAPGVYRLRAEADGADAAVSADVRVAEVTEILMPRYIQGVEPDNNDRVPYAFRVRIDGLEPNSTYRYGNRIEEDGEPPTQDGAGNMIFVDTQGGPFVRNTDAPDFDPEQFGIRHAEFTTDSTGSHEGWFVTEPTGNQRFVPGQNLRMRILLNDGAGGEQYQYYLSTQSPVEVREYGEASAQGSAVYGEAFSGPRNFVFLYDDEDGAGRPVAGTVVETTGSEIDERYASFYAWQVAPYDGFWGTLIPNDLEDGIIRVEERSLLDGGLLDATVREEPVSGTVMASHGAVPVYADLRDGPVFLPSGDGDWNVGGNWSTGTVPDGPGEKAIVRLASDPDREVWLGQNITLGRFVLDNDTASRQRLTGDGGGLTFQGDSEAAILRVGGQGVGFNEFRIVEGITLADDLRIAVDNVNAEGEFGALRIREALSGPGGLIKEGAGVMSLTGGGKDYTGPTRVAGGVLRVTESSVPGGTSGVTVTPGGQLRLVSHGPIRSYTFGGTLTLDSLGPEEGPVALPQAGRLGALRLDPELEIRESDEDVHEGTVTNDILFAGDSHVHVDGSSNQLTLSGSLAGTGTFYKSGGGTVVLTGNNDLYEGGTFIMTGTLFVDSGSALGTGPLEILAEAGSEPELYLNNSVQTVSLLEGDLDDESSIAVSLAQGSLLDVAQDGDSRYQGELTGSGSLLKRGEGVLRLTRGPNTLLGSVTVEEGVLEITESSQPAAASEVSVEAGGQLRLTSTGERSYTLGGNALTLAGTGIDPERSASKGALRQDGDDATDVATLTNDVVLSGGVAGIHANRGAGDGSTLVLSGALSGDADLFKTGGGTLVLSGDNSDLSGGTIIENGLVVVETGSRLGDGPLMFVDPDRERRLELRNASQNVGMLSGEVDAIEGGTLEILLEGAHHLTVDQTVASLFEGEFSGTGDLTKTGLATLVLSGDSPLAGQVSVDQGTLQVDGSLGAITGLVVGQGARVEGTGTVGPLEGAGTVAPGGDDPGILDAASFAPEDGLGATFVFGQTGSPDYGDRTASGNDVLRLSAGTAFGGELGSGNRVEIFLDVPDLSGGDTFLDGFFLESGEGFDERISGVDFAFFVRDGEGDVDYRGATYRPYTGPLVASVDTVEDNGGRVMRLSWQEGGTYADWAAARFPDPSDETIAGPDADPDGDGVANLMEYALGGDPLEASRERLPEIGFEDGVASIVFYRDANLSDIAYIVEASSDLETWDDVLYDSRTNTEPNNLGDRMRVEDGSGDPRRFLRLRVVFAD